FNKYPIHELKCPRGLQEMDFLDLLKSTFPQLADGQPFTVLALQGRKMIPLKVDSVIPEEIRRASNSVRSPVICIQLTVRRHLPTFLYITTSKYPIVEFQCPGNLQKAEFLNLLRSTFPQLAGEAFEFLTGHGKNMRPINLENLTSDEFSRTLRLAGSSVFYIRLKVRVLFSFLSGYIFLLSLQRTPMKLFLWRRQKSRLRPSAYDPGQAGVRQHSLRLNCSASLFAIVCKYDASSKCLSSTKARRGPHPSRLTPVSLHVLTLLKNFMGFKSTPLPAFPSQLSSAQTSEESVTHGLKIEQAKIVDCEDRDDDKKAESTRLSSLQPQISGQVPKQSSSTEDVIVVEQNEDIDAPNITTNIKIEEVEFIHSEDDTGESCRTLSPQPQTSSEDSEQHNITDAFNVMEKKDLNHSDANLNSKLGISTTTNKNMLSCKVCKVLHSSRRILARHAWRHVDDQSRLCGVCGKQFNSASAIRYHLETYQKTHKCKICDKTLLSLQGFKGHMNRHKGNGDRTYVK
ncbi:hypothetical protein GOODEAATRI_014762, partial [Goodea atripinnis]